MNVWNIFEPIIDIYLNSSYIGHIFEPDIQFTYILIWHILDSGHLTKADIYLTYIWTWNLVDLYFNTNKHMKNIWNWQIFDIYLRPTLILIFFWLFSLVPLVAKTQTWRESNLKTFNSSLKLSVGLSGAGKYYRLCWLHIEKNKDV